MLQGSLPLVSQLFKLSLCLVAKRYVSEEVNIGNAHTHFLHVMYSYMFTDYSFRKKIVANFPVHSVYFWV